MMDKKSFEKIRLGIGALAGIGAYKFMTDLFSKNQNLGLLKGVGVFGLGLAGAATAMVGVDAFGKAAEKAIFKEEEVLEEETNKTDDEEEEDE